MSNWEVIFISALVSIILRSLPFIFFKIYKIPTNGKLAEFLGYSANAVIGGIIYTALFSNLFYHALLEHFNYDQIIKLIVIVIAFFVAIKTKAIFKTLAVCLSVYTLFLLTIN